MNFTNKQWLAYKSDTKTFKLSYCFIYTLFAPRPNYQISAQDETPLRLGNVILVYLFLCVNFNQFVYLICPGGRL
jgi:hypothetical protein